MNKQRLSTLLLKDQMTIAAARAAGVKLVRRSHPDGSVDHVIRAPGGVELTVPREQQLADGSIGYFVRFPRKDDCFAAALATAVEVPIERVPDPRIDERLDAGETADDINRSTWEGMRRWLAGLGLRAVVHQQPAARKRWIGIVHLPGDFMDHCLVMSGREVLFDPCGFTWPGHPPVRTFGFEDVTTGLSFQTVPPNHNT